MRLLEWTINHIYERKFFPLSLIYFHDLRALYSQIDAKGKVVVDVGADYGCTPLMWAIQGAKKVVAFEKDDGLRERMRRFLGAEDWLEIRGKWTKDDRTPGDIIKFDCEGCERGLDAKDLLETYPEVLMVHHVFDPAWNKSITHEKEVWTEYLRRSS